MYVGEHSSESWPHELGSLKSATAIIIQIADAS